jgi:hypothetical protein
MIQLFCINNKPVYHANGGYSTGDGLVEGEIYSAEDSTYIHPNKKKECYLILKLNDLKLTTRFVRLSNIDEKPESSILSMSCIG